jgi:hypothetical protein
MVVATNVQILILDEEFQKNIFYYNKKTVIPSHMSHTLQYSDIRNSLN